MKFLFYASLLALALLAQPTLAQTASPDSTYRRYFIGSSLFMLANLNAGDPNRPDFVQLNAGYRLTPKNVFSVEAITWKYAWPLGIPYGKSYQAPAEKYPGYVRSFGLAFVYQRFWWKGAYAAVHALNTLQRYVGNDQRHLQNGYQLFMTYRLGYHVPLFRNRFFVEPSVAVTNWPINTNVPESFAKLERKWPNYFLFEPGLHFGVKF